MSYQKHNFTPGAVLLASQLNDMDNEIETLSQGGSGGTVLSDDFKEALLNCFENVAWINENGQTYYDALYNSLYSDNMWFITNVLTGCATSNNATSILKNNSYVATITANEGYTLDGATVSISMGGNDVTNLYYSSGSINIPNVTGNLVITVSAVSNVSYITATFDQGEDIIYDTDSLDVLNQYLTVRAFYDNSESIILDYTEYELSGTLTEGTSIITVSYSGKTTTFNVTVVHQIVGWYYPFNGSILSDGTEEFGFTGEGVYTNGLFNRQAYSRIIPDGTAEEDRQQAIKAINVSKFPNFGGDYTLSFWAKTQGATSGYPFWATYYNSGMAYNNYYSSVQSNASGWSVTNNRNGPANAGFGFQIYQGKINPRISASSITIGGLIEVTPPSKFVYTDWHHYAMTRKGTTVRLFVDGVLIATAVANNSTVYPANQVCIYDIFKNSSGTTDKSDLSNLAFGGVIQDLYIAEFCKWESTFDPQTIIY